MNVTKIYVDTLSMHGCGCYNVFSGARIFESETIHRSTCNGSLEIRQRNGKLLTISGDLNVTKIYVDTLSMHGCGCYNVFSGRYGKGMKVFISHGRKLTKHELGLRKVKSIYRVQC